MADCLSEIERKVLAAVQEGVPVCAEPYRELASRAGLSRSELLEVLQHWKDSGVLRRVGAIVNHLESGHKFGAMVVWRVDSRRVDEIAEKLAGHRQISHAYERQAQENWPYNLYTMIHGRSDEDLEEMISRISRECRLNDYRVLKTVRELKKVGPSYITD